jgi:hypothetical protein
MKIERADARTPAATLDQVVSIHMEQLRAGFLPALGPRVLRRVYKHAAKHAHLYMAKDRDKVTAFVMGTVNPGEFYKSFAIRNFIPVSFAVALRPAVLVRALSGAKYAASSSKVAAPELLSIAVSPAFARRGISQKLFRVFSEAMGDEGLDSFHIVMADTQTAAAEFYKKQNCQFGAEQNIGGLRCFNLTASGTAPTKSS